MNLKFRVFDTKNNKYIEDLSNFWISPLFNNVFMEWRSEWDGETVFEFNDKDFVFQQWTGLVDENGKEIYDGDIVITYDKIHKIEWRKAYSGFQFCEVEPSGELCDLYGGISSDAVVIGNIFENPELL